MFIKKVSCNRDSLCVLQFIRMKYCRENAEKIYILNLLLIFLIVVFNKKNCNKFKIKKIFKTSELKKKSFLYFVKKLKKFSHQTKSLLKLSNSLKILIFINHKFFLVNFFLFSF